MGKDAHVTKTARQYLHAPEVVLSTPRSKTRKICVFDLANGFQFSSMNRIGYIMFAGRGAALA